MEGSKVHGRLKRWFGKPWGFLLVLAAFVLEALLLKPETYETYSMTLHGFILGMLAFLFGFIFIYSGEAFWTFIRRWRWLTLSIAVMLFLLRYFEFQLKAPNYLLSVESNMWIFAALGLSNKYLQKPGRALRYLTQAAYPVYILHMIFLYIGSYLIFPTDISPVLQLLVVVLCTFTGSFVSYELIRRVRILRPLFGLSILGKTAHRNSNQPAMQLEDT